MTPRSVERARRDEKEFAFSKSEIFSMNGYRHRQEEESPSKLVPLTQGILKSNGSALAVREMVAKN